MASSRKPETLQGGSAGDRQKSVLDYTSQDKPPPTSTAAPSSMTGTAATRPQGPRAPAPAPRRPRRLPGALLLLGLALGLALAGGAAGQEPGEEVEALFSEASARCRVEFNATGFPEAVVFRAPEKTEVFSDRPARLAATTRARLFAEDFAEDFAGDPPNVAVTGWRKRKGKKGGWRRAYAVVTATAVAFDAAARELRYAVVQFPGQVGATKGFRAGGEGGARREALRFCTGFVDSSPIIFTQWPYSHWSQMIGRKGNMMISYSSEHRQLISGFRGFL